MVNILNISNSFSVINTRSYISYQSMSNILLLIFPLLSLLRVLLILFLNPSDLLFPLEAHACIMSVSVHSASQTLGGAAGPLRSYLVSTALPRCHHVFLVLGDLSHLAILSCLVSGVISEHHRLRTLSFFLGCFICLQPAWYDQSNQAPANISHLAVTVYC